MPTLQTYKGVYLWEYVPSLALAIVFGVAFALTTLAHTWKIYNTRLWFCSPFAFGGLRKSHHSESTGYSYALIRELTFKYPIVQIVGYIFRALAANNTGSLAFYITQATCLVLPPVLYAASLYMVYSRIVRAVHGEAFSFISPRWTSVIFVVGDLICLNIQGNAAGLLADDDLINAGRGIIIAGLLLQAVIFILFMLCCVLFHVRFRRHLPRTNATTSAPWEASLNMLYATSTLVLARNIFRVFEYAMGKDGFIQKHEWTFYVFDSALMLLVMIGFYIWYPSKLQKPGRDSIIDVDRLLTD